MSRKYKYKPGKYVENSTKGSSRIEPRTYKRDVLMQVWMQSRHLATLLKWLDSSGVLIRFRSEIVQVVIEQVLHHLVDSGEVEMIEFAEGARVMLENRFGAASNPSGRGEKNVYHNLTLDSRRKELGIEPRTVMAQTQTSDEQSTDTSIDWEKIQKKIKVEEEEEAREKLRESMERIREAGQIDKDGVITPMGKGSSVVYQEDMDAFEKREQDRVDIEEDEKKLKSIESAQEKLKEELCLMEVEEHEEPNGKNGGTGEGVPEGSGSDSRGAEEEGTDTGTDSS